jgi:hypothetical protein
VSALANGPMTTEALTSQEVPVEERLAGRRSGPAGWPDSRLSVVPIDLSESESRKGASYEAFSEANGVGSYPASASLPAGAPRYFSAATLADGFRKGLRFN